jgi:hypothetical protein
MMRALNARRLSRRFRQATVVSLLVVFVCIPVLSRLNRRFMAIDRGTSYRFSRSIAVPLERYALSPGLEPTVALAPAAVVASADRIVLHDSHLPTFLFVLPASAVRAPPER